jgi:preprotein translocase subunit SecE
VGQKPPTPAKPAQKPAAQPKPDHPLIKWYKDLRTELKKVVWPTRETAINLTILVIAVCVVVGIFLGIIDFAFSELLTRWLSAA